MVWPRAAFLAFALVFVAPFEAEARRVFGAQIPDDAEPTGRGTGHFVVRKPWEKLMKELQRSYREAPGIVIRRISTPPSVKAYYVENTRRGRTWDGINVYRDLDKRVNFLTVLPRRRDGR